jgi:hypothetical protein
MTAVLAFLQEQRGSSSATAQQLHDALHLHLGVREYLLFSLIFSVITTVASLILKSWIEESVKKSFAEKLEAYKLELSRQLEDYKRDLNRREQAVKVAELLSLVKSGTAADIMKANQLSWELSLWLPSDTAKALAKVLARAVGAPSRNKLLIDVRCILLGLKDPDLAEIDIATFPNPVREG